MAAGDSTYNSKNADKFVVRLPEGMRDRIAVEARRNHRSMNSEIVARLETSLSQADEESGDEAEDAAGAARAGVGSEGPLVPMTLTEPELQLVRRIRELGERKCRALLQFII